MYSISIFYLTFYFFEGAAYAPNATPCLLAYHRNTQNGMMCIHLINSAVHPPLGSDAIEYCSFAGVKVEMSPLSGGR